MRAQPLVRLRTLATVSGAYIRHDAVEDFSYPMSIVLGQLAYVFPVFLYYFIARLEPAATGAASARVGGDYLSFVVVGLAVGAALQASLSGFGNRLQWAHNKGVIETLLVEPVPWRFIPVAMNLWSTLLGCISAVLMLLMGVALGADYRIAGILPLAGILLLGLIAATIIGTLSACIMLLAKRSQPLLVLYGLAASLLGGAMFPIATMPPWLRGLSYLIPHAYIISAAREVLMLSPPQEAMGLGTAVTALIIFDVVVGTAAFLLFGRALQYSRKMGMLGAY